MKINSFKNHNYTVINEKDSTQRDIGFSSFHDCSIIGRNSFYPNCLVYSNTLSDFIISPYDEKILSLNKDCFYDNNEYSYSQDTNIKSKVSDVFFFIYNFDNYYHYLYDTLPYLYVYLYLLYNVNKNIKLLVNYPNKNMNKFYNFNLDILYKIVDKDCVIIHNDNNVYENLYISSSLTHGGFSNNQPRKEIYDIYNIIQSKSIIQQKIQETYDYIYISRRTWINNDLSNIGTNYTTRRKMMNEDKLVEELAKLGVKEIFCENLSINEKIHLFSDAKIIIGSIGGGMVNLLFSKKSTISLVIVTPFFLDINYRFKYSLENTNIKYIDNVDLFLEKNKIPLYTRVKINQNDKIGEISDFIEGRYKINISNNDIAGFNNNGIYDTVLLDETEFVPIDKGLNSPYIVDIDTIIQTVKTCINSI